MASTRVCTIGDIPPDAGYRVELPNGIPVALFTVEGQVYAIGDTCSHEQASLSDGDIEEGALVECPKHGAQFDIKTGMQKTLPATQPVPSFAVRVDGNDVYVEHD